MTKTLKTLEKALRENGSITHWASDFNNDYNENHVYTCKVKDIETYGKMSRLAHLLVEGKEDITITTTFRNNLAYCAIYYDFTIPVFNSHISEKNIELVFEILWEK